MRMRMVLVVGAVALACCRADEITLMANGRTVTCTPPPTVHEGHVYVPLRAAAEAVGGKVEYDAAAKRVTICRGDLCTIVMQSEGIMIAGRLLVGIRQVGEALNASVRWDAATRTVHIMTGG
ncbi:MAG: copper amine oxidase N-terminal domain-containing protein [Armatimonadota bacterium]